MYRAQFLRHLMQLIFNEQGDVHIRRQGFTLIGAKP